MINVKNDSGFINNETIGAREEEEEGGRKQSLPDAQRLEQEISASRQQDAGSVSCRAEK